MSTIHHTGVVSAGGLCQSTLTLLSLIAVASFLGCDIAVAEALLSKQVTVDVAAQPMGSALLQFSAQTGLQIMTEGTSVSDKTSPGVKGTLPVGNALKMLLDDSGLSFRERHGSVLVTPAAVGASASAANALTLASADVRSDTNAEGPVSSDASATSSDQSQNTAPNRDRLDEVVVTGSRLTGNTVQTRSYPRELLDLSGAPTVTDFLNTLSEVSLSTSENGFQPGSIAGSTTVRLRGLPEGETLLLLNGRRLETSGVTGAYDTFDLNNIPMAAIDRVEVVSSGSSAVYGSDAIAGVVNIILKKELKGLTLDAKYSWAKDLPEWDTTLAWGNTWDRGSVSLLGSFMSRGTLTGFDRSITANSDFTRYGGIDARYPTCNPGNVFFPNGYTLNGTAAQYAAVPKGYAGTPSIAEFSNTANTLNQCSIFPYTSIVPESRRGGLFFEGTFSLTESVELFTETMYSHTQQNQNYISPLLFGEPGFQLYTVGPANPYNPFGQSVGVSYLFTSVPGGYVSDTDFIRPLIGARGSFSTTWTWETAAWVSRDQNTYDGINQITNPTVQSVLDSSNPATALNLFTAGTPGSPALLRSLFSTAVTTSSGQTNAVNGFVRGSPFHLPGGNAQLVIGAEYNHNQLNTDEVNDGTDPPNTKTDWHRTYYAMFGEARVPLVGKLSDRRNDYLALSVAGRYDHYDGFGGKGTPQISVDWRPFDFLLARGSFSTAFKAPPLAFLDAPQQTYPNSQVTDPLRGNQVEVATVVTGGNPTLKPETAHTHVFTLQYSDPRFPSVTASISQWDIDETNSFQELDSTTIIDNESLFPTNVTRSTTCSGGAPCPITQVNATYINFGELHVAGVDYSAEFKHGSPIGTLSADLNASQIYHFTSALTPDSAAINSAGHAQDSGVWSPRWKGSAILGLARGALKASFTGRYIGKYEDYDSTNEIGNFWLFDTNVRYTFPGFGRTFDETVVEAGARNLFDRTPQYSNFKSGLIGYDPATSDLVGRVIYLHFGFHF